MELVEISAETLINDYQNGLGLESLCSKYHVGKNRVKQILNENSIPLKHRGGQKEETNFILADWSVEKYEPVEGKHYIALSKDGNFSTSDYLNASGALTSYIKKTFGKSTSLYERRKYYMQTGDYWWEQWFNIVLVDNSPKKRCPYCEWETCDLENKSGAFKIHLNRAHNMPIADYLKEHPEDFEYFSKDVKKIEKKVFLSNKKNFVVCPICGEKMEKITPQHIFFKHGLAFSEFRKQFPNVKVLSENMYSETVECAKKGNLTVSKKRFVSKYEKEIQNYLKEQGINFIANRQILGGREIDLLIEDKKIGIEFDGLKFHTEWFGKKSHRYHLEKTEKCNQYGYGLIHIFEDEYVNKKEIVYNKISHLLGLDSNKPSVAGRKCVVREIFKYEAKEFLDKFHIQGFSSSTLYLGAFFGNELIGVMCFKHGNLKNYCWELTRFATNPKYKYQGVGSKMFSYFCKKENPDVVISFADRRWTINPKENLYTKMGFVLDSINPPDYRYYNERVDRYKRVHKMYFNKQKLAKKYGFPITLTETEMVKSLGYDRIWDCGLIKYIWKNHPE